MWFSVLSILLITTPIVHGSEDSQLAIKELHYEISKVAREVQELYVESDTAQIALDEKTKKALEEYIQIDISSGLPEQIELLELKDKADEVKTSEETRKAVMDGLEYLENVKEMESDDKQLSDIVTSELKAIGKTIEAKIPDRENFTAAITTLQKHYDLFQDMIQRKIFESDQHLKEIKRVMKEFMDDDNNYVKGLKRMSSSLFDIPFISFDFLGVMKSEIAKGKKKIEEIRKLKEEFDLPQKILPVKKEIKVMEELRDSKVTQKLLDFMEKIKGSFESIKGSGLDLFEWKIGYFSKKWIPIQDYLKNLKVPTENQTKSLTKIEECLQAFDFSMEFLTEEYDAVSFEKIFKPIRAQMDIYFEVMKDMERFKVVSKPMEDLAQWLETGEKNSVELAMIRKELAFFGDKTFLAKVPDLVDALTELQYVLKKLDTAPIKTVTEGITSKISKVEEFLNCSSSLKIVPSEVKSLMDQPKEVWNFDARPLESVLEVVYLFKEAHRFLVDKKQPVPIDGFPLTKEEVTGISDGLRILKAILDYQKLWNEIPLTEVLIDLEIHSKLPTVQFPKDIDSLISFYSTQYQGPQRRRILKILEGVKDYPQFPSKLEKMNEAVGKWKNWGKEQNPEEQNVDGEELIDCSERTCELTLPEANPEDSVKKVEL